MATAKNKTIETDQSVAGFLNTVADDVRRADGFRLMGIMKEATGFEPKMWGNAIVGYGSYHYKYDSGREGDAPKAGFSPRAKEFALYLAKKYADRDKLIQQLGKYKERGGCMYIKKMTDINEDVLRKMITLSIS